MAAPVPTARPPDRPPPRVRANCGRRLSSSGRCVCLPPPPPPPLPPAEPPPRVPAAVDDEPVPPFPPPPHRHLCRGPYGRRVRCVRRAIGERKGGGGGGSGERGRGGVRLAGGQERGRAVGGGPPTGWGQLPGWRRRQAASYRRTHVSNASSASPSPIACLRGGGRRGVVGGFFFGSGHSERLRGGGRGVGGAEGGLSRDGRLPADSLACVG